MSFSRGIYVRSQNPFDETKNREAERKLVEVVRFPRLIGKSLVTCFFIHHSIFFSWIWMVISNIYYSFDVSLHFLCMNGRIGLKWSLTRDLRVLFQAGRNSNHFNPCISSPTWSSSSLLFMMTSIVEDGKEKYVRHDIKYRVELKKMWCNLMIGSFSFSYTFNSWWKGCLGTGLW